ncbi:MAG TPA: Mut7-C RNAse domain-containing protein [Spirochaetota bacterium]|nr:Mut7-C RNAse domain-containing protein [Spirochaetota bacterium]HOM10189.1 Mut7-C RNAse domain-containing protein [Spirochaetota bacterium]HPP48789.1 Mut7-C RNAse domain-containing protein [Spirochaetota bacterium]HXK65468.1 Mut7-C RNAse domain-containing protein [Spirochaetota bacterium]
MKEYTVTIRFYEELNDFLPKDKKKVAFTVSWEGKRSIKDLIESLGVPHVEVDLIQVNGISVGFDYIVQNDDYISVYPVFERFEISNITRLRPQSLRAPAFVCDVHLRKLVKYLRLFGFDVLYNETWDDKDLAHIAAEQKRILLTRDRQLLMRKIVDRGLIVRNTSPQKQIVEILDRLDLWDKINPFSRCIMCNGNVTELSNNTEEFEKEKNRIPPGVLSWCNTYYKCTQCGRIYWEGSHYEKLTKKIETIINQKSVDKDS